MGEGALTGAAAGTAIAPGVGTIIGSGIGLLGDVIGGLFSSSGQKSANKTNIQLAREQRDWNEEMWNKQNAYNTPQAQIERMRAAGLNPALMYSQGNVGNASQVPSYSPAHVQNELAGIGQGISSAGGHFMDYMMKNEQLKQMMAQTQLMWAKADKERSTTPDLHDFQTFWRNRSQESTYKSSIAYEEARNWQYKNKYADDVFSYQHNKLRYDSELADSLRRFVDQNGFYMSVYNKAKGELYTYLWQKAKQEYHELTPTKIEYIDKQIMEVLENIKYKEWQMKNGLNNKDLLSIGSSLFTNLFKTLFGGKR